MPAGETTYTCAACRKAFRVEVPKPGAVYRCPACKAPLEEEPPTVHAGEVELAEPPVPREIPVRLGKYLIDREIARGGMGVVYEGRQEGLDRRVAIKMLLGGLAGDAESIGRFRREARAAARLRHPNIVAIHEVGEFNGQPFFTMDYIEGTSLEGVLREGPMSTQRAARILREVARAVHFAHEEGIIHRDLKPGNILIDPQGVSHVTDFGLARELDASTRLSITGTVMGTPAFMSPEQAEGRLQEVDRQSDVYSLGAILYRILTGKPPFEGPTLAATIYKVVHEYTTEPVRLNPRVEPDLSAVCMKALEKDRARRYPTAEEFARDLERFLAGDAVSAKPLTSRELLFRKLRRNRRAVVAAAAAGGAVLVVVLGLVFFLGRSELDLIEENLARPEMRLTALGSLLGGLEGFDDRDRALGLARKAVGQARDDAARELAYAQPNAALAEAYVAHLAIERPEKLRIRAIRILAGLKHRPAAPAVLEVLRNARGEVRREAVRFFRAVPDVSAFYDLGALVSDREVGEDARQALQRLYLDRVLVVFNPAAGRATGALVELGAAIEKYNRQLEEATRAAGPRAPRDAVEMAIAELKGADRNARMKAAYELGNSKDARAREPLLAALLDPEDGVARMAAAGLAALGAGEFKSKLGDQLRHPRPVVRRNAAFLLGAAGDKSFRPAIEAAYRSEADPDAKYAMEDALVALR